MLFRSESCTDCWIHMLTRLVCQIKHVAHQGDHLAAKVVVGERDGGGDGSGVGEMREREKGENFRGN